MKKLLLTTLLLSGYFISVYAQYPAGDSLAKEKKGFDKSRLFIGGNFGLSFGDYVLVNVSPQVGYRINNHFAAGVGINGQYTRIKDRYANYTAVTTYGVTGMNLFGRVYPIPQLFLHVQPELNYIWGSYDNGVTKNSLNGKILPSLLAGAGAMIPMGSAGGLTLMVQYDLLNKSNTVTDPGTPYGSRPFVSIGFNIGLR